MTRWTDIGHGVRITFTTWSDYDQAGLLVEHPRDTGGWYAEHPPEDNPGTCTSGVLFDLPGVREAFPANAVWTVERQEPLTLSPSLLCRMCGHHGWIREGLWVPA